MTGTRVVCTDLDTGESDEAVIEDDYVLVCDGDRYLDSVVSHADGTVVLTVKVAK